MNKTNLLFQMMEHPQAYSADEWQQTLLDNECRELYTLMSKTRSAIDSARANEQITDQVIDDEWQRFEMRHYSKKPSRNWMKIAASFIGLLIASGIVFAAIRISHRHQKQEVLKTEVTESMTSPATTVHADTPTNDTVAVQPVVYDNIPLEKMLPEIAAHYDVEVTFANEAVRGFRFSFVWNPQQGIDQVISDLNQFERLTVTSKDNQITVK